MPYKKEIARRRKLPENIWAFLRDELPNASDDMDIFLLQDGQLQKLWDEMKEGILEGWISAHPGTRPSLWWRFDAPSSPRERVGGKGELQSEHLAVEASYEFGIPTGWLSEFHERHFPHLKGKAIDPDNPPLYESQASYLQRHNLLTDAEMKFVEKHPELLEPEKAVI
jgi:hypothetical protein